MDINKPMAIIAPNLDYEMEDSSLCLEQLKCGHFCYEPRHNSLGFIHGPCLTLMNAQLKCGHTELIHCFEERRSLGCSICCNVQTIIFVYEADPNNSANNNINKVAPAQMHLDGQRANEPGSGSAAEEVMEMDTDSGITDYNNSQGYSPAAAAIPLGQLIRRFEQQLGIDRSPIVYSTVQTTQIQLIFPILGKRNFDNTSMGSSEQTVDNFDYRSDETSATVTKKCGMDKTNAKGT